MINLLKRQTYNLKSDILSGITVALALVPEAIAFSFIAGVDPIVGLHAAFMIGLITSIFGGRPGMISGATGALAVVMVSLVIEGNKMGLAMETPVDGMGLQYLFLTVILMGVVQVATGAFKLGKFSRLIPHSVMLGFVNGLAIVIFISQLGMFKETTNGVSDWMASSDILLMLSLVAGTMFIMFFTPKITKKVPSGLVAIVFITVFVNVLHIDVSTVGSFIKDGGGSGFGGGLPTFQSDLFTIIPINIETLKFVFPYVMILAAIGVIESLLTLNLIDELTETRGNSNKECIGLGFANIITGLFGGMGGCAMIGQSVINFDGGGRGRLSGLTAAIALLIFILFGASYIELIPIAALTGIMFMVVIGTFAWSSIRLMNKIPFSDAFVVILVSALTVFFDLALAVIAGVIISSLVFSWENAKRIRARKSIKEDGTKVYEIWGPLFFGSTKSFASKFDVKNDPKKVEINFLESKVSDHSAVDAILNLVAKYKKEGIEIQLKHLSDDCVKILTKTKKEISNIIIKDIDDPKYYVMTGRTEDFY